MKFSLLMSIYGKESPLYFNECMRSTWSEQSLRPSEVVLICDGPLPHSLHRVIADWKRIIGEQFIVLELDQNRGLAAALNYGLNHCSNELVARMDTDDIACRYRFERQMMFMKENPEVGCVGTNVIEISENGDVIQEKRMPLGEEGVMSFLKTRNPLAHPSVMFRKSLVQAVGCYPLTYPEDYLLWIKMINNGVRVRNIEYFGVCQRVGREFFKRRGLRFLFGELVVHRYIYKCGLCSYLEYLKIIFSRVVLRLMPGSLQAVAYRKFRG